MAKRTTRTAQQRAARELALTRPADPYRGSLTDPFTAAADLRARRSAAAAPGARNSVPAATNPSPASRAAEARYAPTRTRHGDARKTPAPAAAAGILGIVLGLGAGIFGLMLLLILSVENSDGAPDRSFYRGTDSGYLILALLDFVLAIVSISGGIGLMNGRVSGRVVLTAAGWASLLLSAVWFERGNVNQLVPCLIALASATMLALAYQASVTRWLGVLPPPQPE